uniref:UPF0149 family protein n=1 Tax=Ningiella ruwaisensis TaxID=2364274 RepID=UPI00109F097D|nr:UPF0149 family protein [Ningiella ruwaisensis]
MSNPQVSYEAFSNTLNQHKIVVDGAEVHGILCGMLAGGMNIDDQSWLEALSETINQGEALPQEVVQALTDVYNQICQQFIEADFSLRLLLPDDASPINERGQALTHWVQGFMLGFGLYQADLSKCSDDVKEALEDFAQIARMDEQMNDDEESEQALFEVVEYVRISAMLCFNELGKSLLDSKQQSPVIH